MDKEKELEEMKAAYEKARLLARATLGSMNKGEDDWYCRYLQNAGYGNIKQAVREFAEELKEIFKTKHTPVMANVACSRIDDLINERFGCRDCETCPDNNNAEYNERNCPNRDNCGR